MFLNSVKKVSNYFKRSFASNLKENQIAIQDGKINYLKVGQGRRVILCLPGVLGTIWTDFPRQVEYFNKSSEFTLICMDMPGCGGSRPPNRIFPQDFYQKDAETAMNLMKNLDVSRYSLMGWSDGGISALILAARYPDNVSSLVVWGANSYVTSNDIKIYQGIRDTDKWSAKMVEPFVAVYGKDVLRKAMSDWYETLERIEKKGGDICINDVEKIRSPTLIIHGDKDPLVPAEHPLFLKDKIPNSELSRFPNGKHNLHLRYHQEFNELVENFLKKH